MTAKVGSNLDQSEVLAKIDVLTLRARYLAADLEAKTGEKTQPVMLGDDDLANFELLEAHCQQLEAKLPTSQPRRYSTGGSSSTVSFEGAHPGAAVPNLTVTERLFAREGVKTLAELSEKRRQQRNAKRARNK